jgi:hypothetical protein
MRVRRLARPMRMRLPAFAMIVTMRVRVRVFA